MKAGFVFAVSSAAAIFLASAGVRAEEKLALEPAVAQAGALDAGVLMPLPPSRPSTSPRRARVIQASATAPAPQARIAPAPARKPSQIWLTMGYGF